MKLKTKCVVAETACEVVAGVAAAIIIDKTVLSKCNKLESKLVMIGTAPLLWALGNAFGHRFYKQCDLVLGTDFMKPLEERFPNEEL